MCLHSLLAFNSLGRRIRYYLIVMFHVYLRKNKVNLLWVLIRAILVIAIVRKIMLVSYLIQVGDLISVKVNFCILLSTKNRTEIRIQDRVLSSTFLGIFEVKKFILKKLKLICKSNILIDFFLLLMKVVLVKHRSSW